MMKRFVITEEDMIQAGIDFDNYVPDEAILAEIEEEANRTDILCYLEDFVREMNK